MVRFKNPRTNETRMLRFRWWMFVTPCFVLHLVGQGTILAGLMSIFPPFAFVNFFLYGSIMRLRYRKKGWVEVNNFGQEIGPVVQAPQAG